MSDFLKTQLVQDFEILKAIVKNYKKYLDDYFDRKIKQVHEDSKRFKKTFNFKPTENDYKMIIKSLENFKAECKLHLKKARDKLEIEIDYEEINIKPYKKKILEIIAQDNHALLFEYGKKIYNAVKRLEIILFQNRTFIYLSYRDYVKLLCNPKPNTSPTLYDNFFLTTNHAALLLVIENFHLRQSTVTSIEK